MSRLELIERCLKYVQTHYTALNEDLLRKAVVHRLINVQVTHMLTHNAAELRERQFASTQDAINSDFVIGPDQTLGQQKQELEEFLYENVYRHPNLMKIREQAQARLKEMFHLFSDNPDFFPPKYRERAEKVGNRRMAVEYIAGMTDHFCDQEFRRLKAAK